MNKTKPDKLVYWCSNDDDALSHASSTRIRKAIQEQEETTLAATMDPMVVRYIVENELFGAIGKDREVGDDEEEVSIYS